MFVRLSTLALAATTLVGAMSPQDIPADTPVQTLLSSAQSHLSRGETSDALVYYDAAIAKDPTNYLTFFKRATTYLSLGRTNQATEDFNEVLRLKPGFEGAHLQLGKIRARVADWDGAAHEFRNAGKGAGSPDMDSIVDAERAFKTAIEAEKAHDWEACVENANSAIAVASRAISLRELRSRCHFAQGDVLAGASDLQHVLQLRPGDTTPHITISAIKFYSLGDSKAGMDQIRKCLISDPDSKVCRKLLKQMKAVDKTEATVQKSFGREQWSSGTRHLTPRADGSEEGLIKDVEDQVAGLKKDGFIPENAPQGLLGRLVGLACQGYYKSNSRKKADEYCPKALGYDENALYALLHKAKQLQDNESYEAAIETIKKASEVHGQDDTINKAMNEAQQALRRSKNKDYYKILSVSRDADERQIRSAWRKLSKQYHPDKAHTHGLNKEEAEKKMAEINQAYEYLTDPEMRAKIDRGEDPAQPNGGGSPFQGSPFGGGHPFMFQQGGGQQQFNFKFGGQGFGGFPGGF